MAVELFISYSRNDPDSVSLGKTIRDELTSRYGYEVFVDVEMDAGIDWKEEINRNIAACDTFLLLISKRATESYEVLEELRYADFLRRQRKRPRMLPVLVNCDLPEGEIKAKIGPINYLLWRTPEDTPRLVAAIDKAISPQRKRRVIRASVAAAVALVIAVLFLYFRHQLAVLGDTRSDEASAVAAYRRLVLWPPRDAMMQHYLEQRARALEQQADTLFNAGEREQRRDRIDEALMLSALAAIKRGGAPSERARNVYAAQHYDRLITTIREPGEGEVPGVGLAVNASPSRWRIAAGGHVWTCKPPLGDTPCELTAKSVLNAVVASVFASGDELYLVDNSGHATRLHLADKSEERRQTGVVDITADGGEIAAAYAVHAPADPSIVIDRADGAQEKSPNLGAIDKLRFGPCGGCLALLGDDRKVRIWHPGSPVMVALDKRPAIAIAARRGRLMVVREDGYLDLYNEYLTRSPGPPIDFRNATAIAMSSDGGSFAVIRNGGVRVNGEKEDLIAPELTPTTVAAAFADGGALVTRTPREVRIWRPDSPKNEKLAPDQLWMKWRKQIGFLDAGQPPPGFGWDPVARDVRRY